MSKRSDEIRDKYIKNPPEGMTADDIRRMSEDDLLDMDYFLHEDGEFTCRARFYVGFFHIKSSAQANFPIK